jgi:glycosyltransferase involved in cell wall biosynthesis
LSERNVRLCIVTPWQVGGGAEYQINLLIGALTQQQRFEVYELSHHVSDAIEPKDYRVVRIGRNPNMPKLGYVMDCPPLYRALRRIRPQVIYQRVGCGYTGISALYARRHRVPLIWHVSHDTDVMRATLDSGRNLLRRRLEKWSIELGIRWADRIVVQTQHQSDLLMRHYGRTADALVPNFHPEAREVIDKSEAPLVVWIANLKNWKRPEIFVRLAAQLRDLPGVQFVMLGEEPDGAKRQPWLATLLQSIASTPNLTYLGRRSQAEVNQILARAWIYVNTSQHEGFPNTFIQAWMRDAVIVSLDVNPDRVLDLEELGVHAGTEEGLERAVRALLRSPALRHRYVERARTYVKATHSLRNAAKLVQLIDACSQRTQPQTTTEAAPTSERPT